jgi:hypothetical protein
VGLGDHPGDLDLDQGEHGEREHLGPTPADGEPPERPDHPQHREITEQPDGKEGRRQVRHRDPVDHGPRRDGDGGDHGHGDAGGAGSVGELLPQRRDRRGELAQARAGRQRGGRAPLGAWRTGVVERRRGTREDVPPAQHRDDSVHQTCDHISPSAQPAPDLSRRSRADPCG